MNSPRWPYIVVYGTLLGLVLMAACVNTTPPTRQLVRCWFPDGDLMYEGHAARVYGWGDGGLSFTDDRTGQEIIIINMPCTVRSGGND